MTDTQTRLANYGQNIKNLKSAIIAGLTKAIIGDRLVTFDNASHMREVLGNQIVLEQRLLNYAAREAVEGKRDDIGIPSYCHETAPPSFSAEASNLSSDFRAWLDAAEPLAEVYPWQRFLEEAVEDELGVDTLKCRTEEALGQLLRYADRPFNESIVNALETLAELNDDLYHLRSRSLIESDIRRVEAELYEIREEYGIRASQPFGFPGWVAGRSGD
jgi:hypothetical protein